MKDICEICGANCKLTIHHLIPQLKFKKDKYKENKTINICPMCHTTIHALFDESELRDNYNTIDKIKENEEFLKYYRWRLKHLDFNSVSTKMSNKRKR